MSTTLTTKGQVTIPKRIRDALGLSPGSPVDFALNAAGEAVLRKANAPPLKNKREMDRFQHARGKQP